MESIQHPQQGAPIISTSGPTRSISISSWSIQSTKLPILSASDSDAASSTLHLPLPEICFGNNRLRIENNLLGIVLEWDALSALRTVERESGVKVAHAAEWVKGLSSESKVEVQKPYDWTYSTCYPGAFVSSTTGQDLTFELAPPHHQGIPLHLLARQDIPILFFDEIPLFEDELGDNGIAELVVRVRVNSSSVFVLSRFFLRVDGVLFRIFDVRLFHAFNSNEIIKETKGRQASYLSVKAKLPADAPTDLKPLTDINWVSGTLETLSIQKSGGLLGGRSLPVPPVKAFGNLSLGDNEKEVGKDDLPSWEGEGVKLEVLRW